MRTAGSARAIGTPRGVVGSIGGKEAFESLRGQPLTEICDWVEVRLDLLDDPSDSVQWEFLQNYRLLLTARREEEGGCKRGWVAADREKALANTLGMASCIDIEVASIPEMDDLIGLAGEARVPWVGSFHDFSGFPQEKQIAQAAEQARQAGAAVFKIALKLNSPDDLGKLAAIQMTDYGIPLATMGMGRLAVVSRLLCAQCGSVLNYGYLGDQATAPGQWDAARLKAAIDSLPDWC